MSGKKKVYTEATAQVTFETKRFDDACAVVNAFFSRRNIEMIGDITYDKQPRRTRAEFTARYRVHGGWRSDFIKRIEADASDLGIELENLYVEVTRDEIPSACPRNECAPCTIALDPSAQFSFAQEPKQERVRRVSDTVQEDNEPPQRRWGFLRR